VRTTPEAREGFAAFLAKRKPNWNAPNEPHNARILVVGAGLMGAGIAQVAAQAGHDVALFDARDGAAEAAKAKLARRWTAWSPRLTAEAAAATLARITPVAALRRPTSSSRPSSRTSTSSARCSPS
jgi:monoamine oxidase